MTVTDQINILHWKIEQNKAQYHLDKKEAKISALSSESLDKYEYLTGQDLDYKPSAVEKAKFEYSPLVRVFNRGLEDEDKKEGLVKRVKNFEDKNKELLGSTKKTLTKIKTVKTCQNLLKLF